MMQSELMNDANGTVGLSLEVDIYQDLELSPPYLTYLEWALCYL